MLLFSTFYLSKNPEKNVWFPQKLLNNITIFNIDHNKYLFEHKISIIIRMIYEGSCE